MSDSNNVVSINDAARIAVSNSVPPVKASARIEQLRAELGELRDEAAWLELKIADARNELECVENELSDFEIRIADARSEIDVIETELELDDIETAAEFAWATKTCC